MMENPKEIEKKFEKELNVFMLLLKQSNKLFAEHIGTIGKQYAEVHKNFKEFKQTRFADTTKQERKAEQWTQFIDECEVFEQRYKQAHRYFNQQINNANATLGGLTNHWGGFVEQMAVIYFLDVLQKQLNVNTWSQKFRRTWDKRGGIEIDILALSEDTAYIIEVKNQLKIEHLEQVKKALIKVNEHVTELNFYKKQSIIMCINDNPEITEAFANENIWIIKYDGFDENEMKNKWVWVSGGLSKTANF